MIFLNFIKNPRSKNFSHLGKNPAQYFFLVLGVFFSPSFCGGKRKYSSMSPKKFHSIPTIETSGEKLFFSEIKTPHPLDESMEVRLQDLSFSPSKQSEFCPSPLAKEEKNQLLKIIENSFYDFTFSLKNKEENKKNFQEEESKSEQITEQEDKKSSNELSPHSKKEETEEEEDILLPRKKSYTFNLQESSSFKSSVIPPKKQETLFSKIKKILEKNSLEDFKSYIFSLDKDFIKNKEKTSCQKVYYKFIEQNIVHQENLLLQMRTNLFIFVKERLINYLKYLHNNILSEKNPYYTPKPYSDFKLLKIIDKAKNVLQSHEDFKEEFIGYKKLFQKNNVDFSSEYFFIHKENDVYALKKNFFSFMNKKINKTIKKLKIFFYFFKEMETIKSLIKNREDIFSDNCEKKHFFHLVFFFNHLLEKIKTKHSIYPRFFSKIFQKKNIEQTPMKIYFFSKSYIFSTDDL